MQNEKKAFNKLIMVLFNDNDKAGKAYNAALKLEYNKEDIGVVMSEEAKGRNRYERKHEDTLPRETAIKGAGVGGALGVTTGAYYGCNNCGRHCLGNVRN